MFGSTAHNQLFLLYQLIFPFVGLGRAREGVCKAKAGPKCNEPLAAFTIPYNASSVSSIGAVVLSMASRFEVSRDQRRVRGQRVEDLELITGQNPPSEHVIVDLFVKALDVTWPQQPLVDASGRAAPASDTPGGLVPTAVANRCPRDASICFGASMLFHVRITRSGCARRGRGKNQGAECLRNRAGEGASACG